MEKKSRKKAKGLDKQKSKKEYIEELKESYKSGIKYYKKVDKE